MLTLNSCRQQKGSWCSQEIATEKAGIFKSGCPAFTSPQLPEAMTALQARNQSVAVHICLQGQKQMAVPAAALLCCILIQAAAILLHRHSVNTGMQLGPAARSGSQGCCKLRCCRRRQQQPRRRLRLRCLWNAIQMMGAARWQPWGWQGSTSVSMLPWPWPWRAPGRRERTTMTARHAVPGRHAWHS